MKSEIAKRTEAALTGFELDDNHRRVWDPNALVAKGFPAEVVIGATRVFKSEEGYLLYHLGEVADEFIGVGHSAFVWEIAKALGVDTSGASQFTGRGFAMRAVIDAIETRGSTS